MHIEYLKVVIEGIFTAIGAFIPIFILMCIHFKIRKIDYRKRKHRVNEIMNICKSMIKINDEAIKKAYNLAGVKDITEIINKLKSGGKDAPKYVEFLTFINKNFEQKTKNQMEINKYIVQEKYLEDYNFKTYISDLLDKRFPEKDITK